MNNNIPPQQQQQEQPLPRPPPRPATIQHHDVYLVFDVEATTEQNNDDFPHEVIEVPLVAICASTGQAIVEFQSYCRPMRNGGRLNAFTTELTGITNEMVLSAPPLQEVMDRLAVWLRTDLRVAVAAHWRKLAAYGAAAAGAGAGAASGKAAAAGADAAAAGAGAAAASSSPSSSLSSPTSPANDIQFRAVFACDGPWDVRKFLLEHTCMRDGISIPSLFHLNGYINIRQRFADHFRCRPMNLRKMLEKLRYTFIGRPHSGIDDSRNIARVLAFLLTQPGFILGRGRKVAEPGSQQMDVLQRTLHELLVQRQQQQQQQNQQQHQQNQNRRLSPLEHSLLRTVQQEEPNPPQHHGHSLLERILREVQSADEATADAAARAFHQRQHGGGGRGGGGGYRGRGGSGGGGSKATRGRG